MNGEGQNVIHVVGSSVTKVPTLTNKDKTLFNTYAFNIEIGMK